MKFAQKLVLVPQEEWEKIKSKDVQVKQVSVNAPLQKVVKSQLVKTQTLTSQKGSGKIQLKKKTIEENLTLFINCFPLSKSDRILTILRYMKDNKDINWTVDGNLKYKGKVIQHSSIVKLLHHTIWKDIKIKPEGIIFFYKALSSLNIPKNVILNELGRSIMKKLRKQKDDKWRPPGKLNRKSI